ncbi:MAG: hypothetical protein CMH53_08675, partial [Myxococcales bacterium]|nr:hypothetical protein [Myxococcales bacterium]
MHKFGLCFVVFGALMLLGCETSSPSQGQKPRDGIWQGDELSFVYRDGQIESVDVHQSSCTGDDGCTRSFQEQILGQWVAWPSIRISEGLYDFDGQFSSMTLVSGAFRWGDPDSECCRAIGAWTAEWVAPLTASPEADAGSSSGPGSRSGSPSWQGASTGDLHPGPSNGPMPLAGSSDLAEHQRTAHEALLSLRAQVGAGEISQDASLAKAAQAHAEFFVMHHSQYKSSGLSPHDEDASFGVGFTGVKANQRMKAAGYDGVPGAEVMAFTGSATGAVQGWLETVYHRLPLIDPSVHAFGYGGQSQSGSACEVMDFSGRSPSGTDPVIVYPWPGQTGVPKSWSGNEGPQPPPPPNGYPSGPVITARVPNVSAWGAHQLLSSDGQEVAHVFLSAETDPNMKMFDSKSIAIYSHEPL